MHAKVNTLKIYRQMISLNISIWYSIDDLASDLNLSHVIIIPSVFRVQIVSFITYR